MELLTLITIIGGIILTLGYLPQLVKLKQTGDTNGINNSFWYLITIAVTITAINLIADSAPLILIVIQIINAILAGVVLMAVHFYREQDKWLLAPVVIFIAMIILTAVLPIEITQLLSSLAIVVAYVTQIITLIKSPKVSGVSPSLYILIALGLGIMATKMFVTEVTHYIITTELINITLLLLCAGLSLSYQSKPMTITIEEPIKK